MAFLQLKSVGQTYFSKNSATTALDDISLSVNDGEFLSLLGPSGCGKSTLLSIIAGLLIPTAGSVLVNNQSVSKPHPKIGYMLQQDYLFPWKTIEENIVLGLNTKEIKYEGTRTIGIFTVKRNWTRTYEKQISLGTFRGNEAKGRTCQNISHPT